MDSTPADAPTGMIVRSSVPFVFIGARQSDRGERHDGVLVRSENADIQLIGSAREKEISPYRQTAASFWPFTRRRFYAMTSGARPPISPLSDKRLSEYTLAWE